MKYSNEKITYLILISPWIVIFTIFWLYPVIYAIYLSFCHYESLTAKAAFIGLENFRAILKDPVFFIALKNTIIFTIVTVPITTSVALFLANLINQKFIRFQKFFRTVFFIPSITSIVVISVIFTNLYSSEGYINSLFKILGLPYPRLGWLQTESTALPAIMAMDVWYSIGYYLIIFLAGLQTISNDYYDVAELSGAKSWQVFWKITFPLIKPTLLFVILLNTIKSFQIFVEIYVMTKGGPLNSTTTLVYHIYDNAFVKTDLIGYASAMALVVFMLLLLLSLAQIRLIKPE